MRDVVAMIDQQPSAAPSGPAPPEYPPSVFAVVAHASGTSLMTTKKSLTLFSHVMEEEAIADPAGAHFFGAFQEPRFYEPARDRWVQLAALGSSAHVFAEFDRTEPDAGATCVSLDHGDPMRREWAVVVDRPSGSMALTAIERPDQDDVPDLDRLFDSTWSTHPATVRKAAIVCATIAASHGAAGAEDLRARLSGPSPSRELDVELGERLLDRLLDVLED